MANKIDHESDRVVSAEEGKRLASSHGLMYFECSAKTGIGVTEAFMGLVSHHRATCRAPHPCGCCAPRARVCSVQPSSA